MIGFLIYISSTIFFPHWFYLLLLLVIPYRLSQNNWKIDNQSNKILFLIVIISLIIGFSVVNRLFHLRIMFQNSDYIPYQLLFIITVLTSLVIRPDDIKIFVIFVVIESLVGIAEYAANVTTFFPNETKEGVFNTSYNLFYYKRVFGLCSNSSTFAIKLLFGIILVDYVAFSKKWKYLSISIMAIAIFCTFNRTVVLSLLFYAALLWYSEFLSFINKILKLKITTKHIIFLCISIVGFTILIIFAIKYQTQIINQFTRSSGKLDLSNRQVVWKMHMDYFLDHPLFGNGSYKYAVPFIHEAPSHAHNSFIQLLSTNGLLITLLYLTIFIVGISQKNYKIILTIILISFFQHILFWGISNEDIFFYMFLFNTKIYESYSPITHRAKNLNPLGYTARTA